MDYIGAVSRLEAIVDLTGDKSDAVSRAVWNLAEDARARIIKHLTSDGKVPPYQSPEAREVEHDG